MPRKTPLGLLALICALAIPALMAPAAFADPCTTVLEDSAGNDWDLSEDGSVGDGEDDAYDDMGEMWLAPNKDETNDGEYTNPDDTTCTYEEDGREIVYPTHTDAVGLGVDASRKVYVPSGGMDFARWLDVIENPTSDPITISYEWYGDYGNVDLIAADEDDNGHVDIGERWAAVADDSEDTDVTSLWDGPLADGWDRPYDDDRSNIPSAHNSDYVDYIYDDVTIPAGGRAIFMHIEHQADSPEAAAAWGEAHNLGADEFFAGMTAEEIADLRNWKPDGDGDGVNTYRDNCPATANADQGDIDGDGFGDACDDDIDGDGYSNTQEEALGTNPRLVDTDGDGRADGVDQCPTRAGNENGCPPVAIIADAPTTPTVFPRLTPNRVGLSVRKSRPTKRKVRLRSTGRVQLPAGLTPADGCRSGAVLVVVKSGANTVSLRLADLKADCTYASRVTMLKARLKRIGNKRLSVQAIFTGNDRLKRRRSARLPAGRA